MNISAVFFAITAIILFFVMFLEGMRESFVAPVVGLFVFAVIYGGFALGWMAMFLFKNIIH